MKIMAFTTAIISQCHMSFHQPIQVPLAKCQAAEARLKRECDHSSSDWGSRTMTHNTMTQLWVTAQDAVLSFGIFLMCHIHTCQWMRANLLHSLKLSLQGTEEKVHPDTYLSSPSTTPKAAWATLVTLGSYQPIICPAANTVWRCTDCKKIKHQQLVLNPLLQVQFLHSFITMIVSQWCSHNKT